MIYEMDEPESIIISTHILPISPLITAPCDRTAATTTMMDVSNFVHVLILLQALLITGTTQL